MRLPRFLLSCLLVCFVSSAPAAAQFTAPQTGTSAETPPPEAQSSEIDSLIRILEDDAARQRLIDTLRDGASAEGRAVAAEETAEPTIARQLAEYTRDVAEGTVGAINAMFGVVENVYSIFSGAAETDLRALMNVVFNVALVIGATFAVFFVGAIAAGYAHRSLARQAENGGLVRRTGMLVGSVLTDALTVLAAWSAGYVFALNLFPQGTLGINQALFLNAFLMIELSKVALRAIFEPRQPTLRLLPLDETAAAYWYFWLSRFASVLGYTFLFVAPILAGNVSQAAAQAVRVVVMLTALAMACAIVLQNKEAVRAFLWRRTAAGKTDPVSRVAGSLAGIWHIVAITYLVAVFILWLAHPETALPFVLAATARTILVVVIGLLVIEFITRFASGGMRLPEDMKQRLPLLESRLNAFVPLILRVVRIVVMIAVLIVIAQVWQIVDFLGWLSSEIGQRVATSVVSASVILILGALSYIAVQSWIEYRLNPNFGRVPTARERTLLSLFRNAFTVVLSVLVAMLVMSELGVNIGPLLAGAGVVGLAVGFGAQKLVQDVITGAFIQFENAMNEGDVVTAGAITGVVEKLTIRSVSLRTLDGAYHLIPFSSVDAVSNFTKNFAYHVAEIGVAYRESIPDVKQTLKDAFDRLRETEFGEHIIGDLEIHGVTEFGDSNIKVRARIKTVAGQQWGVGRAYNEIVKALFDERDIEIPYPHLTLYLGRDKQGRTEAFRVESIHESRSETPPQKTLPAKPARDSKRPRKKPIQQDGPPGEGHDGPDDDEV